MPQHDHSASDFPKLSAPAQRALASAGITCLADLTTHSEAEIARLHGMGPKALAQLRSALAERGFAFAGATSVQG